MSHFESDHSPTRSELERSYCLTADFFLYFTSPAALMVLNLLRKRGMTSLAISRKLGMKSQFVLDQLKAMELEGILVSSVRSEDTFYRIADSQIAKAFEKIMEFPERKLKKAAP